MNIPTADEIMKAFDHKTIAERVITLETAFYKLMELPCSSEHVNIIKDAFTKPLIGHDWNQLSNKNLQNNDAERNEALLESNRDLKQRLVDLTSSRRIN